MFSVRNVLFCSTLLVGFLGLSGTLVGETPKVAAPTKAKRAAPDSLSSTDPADPPKLGATPYIQYWPGELPIVISAPHGGPLKPAELPDRKYGRLQRDTRTMELAKAIREAMGERFGKKPHLAVCLLARVKLDCNREVIEAAQGGATAETAWRDYHGFIDSAAKEVLSKYPGGLYLDIHGHSHQKAFTEIGYLLGIKDLRLPDQRLNGPDLIAKSSIKLLAEKSPDSFADLVRGPNSLGGLLEARGIPCVPSPKNLPELDDLYFFGGYSTETHGSRGATGPSLDGVQLETPYSNRDTAEHRAEFARALTDAVAVYLARHAKIEIEGKGK